MSFFAKSLRGLQSGGGIFNKIGGAARGIFSKAPMVLRGVSGGLGQASRALGSVASQSDKLLSDPATQALARQIGAGGFLGGARGLTGSAGSASALLGQASAATNPSSYSGLNPAQAASSAIERAKSLGGGAKKLFM